MKFNQRQMEIHYHCNKNKMKFKNLIYKKNKMIIFQKKNKNKK